MGVWRITCSASPAPRRCARGRLVVPAMRQPDRALATPAGEASGRRRSRPPCRAARPAGSRRRGRPRPARGWWRCRAPPARCAELKPALRHSAMHLVVEAGAAAAREEDERLGRERGERHRAALPAPCGARERMIGAHERRPAARDRARSRRSRPESCGASGLRMKPICRRRSSQRVDLLHRHLLLEHAGGRPAAALRNARMVCGERRDQRGRRREADLELADLAALRPSDDRRRPLGLLQRRPRLDQQRAPGLGQLDPAIGALEQPRLEASAPARGSAGSAAAARCRDAARRGRNAAPRPARRNSGGGAAPWRSFVTHINPVANHIGHYRIGSIPFSTAMGASRTSTERARTTPTRFDPVTLEIFWSRLISIADEAAAGLLRTAFSTIVRESNDYATVLMDRNGNSVSENTGGIASFSCILPRTTKAFLAALPGRDLAAGRLRHHQRSLARHRPPARFHLRQPDLPSRRAGRLRRLDRAFARRRRRAVVGRLPRAVRGRHPHPARSGSCARASRNDELIELILANVRVPRQVLGDFEAQVTANEVCVRRAEEFLAGRRSRRPAAPGAQPSMPAPTSPCAAPSRRCPTAPTGRRSRPTASTSSSPASPAP